MPDDEIRSAAARALELSEEGKVGMAPREKWGLRPRVAQQFSDTTGVRDTAGFREPGSYEQTNRAARAKAKEFVSEKDAREFFGASAQEAAEKPPRSAWSEAESNLFGAAQGGTLNLNKSREQKHEEYKEAVRVNTARAREAAKTARQEARWAAQDERDTKLKGWLESRTEDQINAFLSSAQFEKLPEHAQNLVHTTLDELGYEAAAEVDLNIEQLEGEEFVIPAATTPLPWEERPEQVDDEVEDEDYADDEEDSTEFAGGRF
jgi:hypothetical protein